MPQAICIKSARCSSNFHSRDSRSAQHHDSCHGDFLDRCHSEAPDLFASQITDWSEQGQTYHGDWKSDENHIDDKVRGSKSFQAGISYFQAMLPLLCSRTPVVVDVVLTGEDDNEYEGDYPQEDHYGCDLRDDVEGGAFVHHKYPAIERDDAQLDEAIANHHYELNGEFKLRYLSHPSTQIVCLLRTFPTSSEIGRT